MAIAEDLRELDDDWKLATISHLIGGMNTDDAPHLIKDSESPNMLNLTPNAQKLLGIDTGFAEFGGVVRGAPRRVFDYLRSNGALEYILVTSLTAYRWVAVESAWQYVSNSTDTTVSTQAVATDTNIHVADSTGFANGDHIGIILDDGTEHQTTVSAVPDGTHVTLTAAIPTGRTSEVGAALVEAVLLAGTLDLWVDGLTVAVTDWLVFTNGVDQPQRYNGTDCIPVPNLPSAPNFKARTVAYFNNYLLFGWCTEGGTERPWRIRRCDTADPSNWSTGNAGFDDLLDGEDGVLRLQSMANRCIAYRAASISVGLPANTADRIFQWQTPVRGEGILGTGGVADVGDEHFCIGTSTVYTYNGGLEITPVLTGLQSFLYGASGDLDPSNLGRSFAFYVTEYNEVWIVYPSVTDGEVDSILRYDFDTEKWYYRILSEGVAGIGVNRKNVARTWNDLVGDWLAQTWSWNNRSLSSNAPTIMLCGATTLQVYEYDYVAGLDNGEDIEWHVESKDFVQMHKTIKIDYLECYIRGNNIVVEYSIDGGETWASYETISPGPSIKAVRMSKQFTCSRVRWRWSGVGGGFAMGWFGFAFREESEV